MQAFLEEGFVLREDITKVQWKMKATREKWRGSKYDFYLLGHEHLHIFRNPGVGEKLTQYKESMKWWDLGRPPHPSGGRSLRGEDERTALRFPLITTRDDGGHASVVTPCFPNRLRPVVPHGAAGIPSGPFH